MTTEIFIEKAKQIHGNKYDYSLVEYKNSKTKIKIICPIHGIFEQNPYNHINGRGCKKCGNSIIATKQTNSLEKALEKAKQIHGNKYDYSLVEYKNNKTKVKIICPIHGIFEQTFHDHLSKKGCPKCGNIKGHEKTKNNNFKNIATKIHGNKYDYSLVEYKNNKTKVKIICPIHGIFEQTPNCHLRLQGCPKCKTPKGEKKIFSFLIKKGIFFESQKKFKDLFDKDTAHLLSYDFYIPSKRLLIEFNGKQHYVFKSLFYKNKTIKDFYIQKHHDWLKRKYAIKNNYNLLVISFKELKNIDNILMEVFGG